MFKNDFLNFLDDEGSLNVSYKGCMNYITRKDLNKFMLNIEKIPWDVFTV